jgi:hypothetical protein
LPKGYSRELPRLLNGPSAGLPRVYDIALETISHGDGRVEPESLSSFVKAYQTVTAPLPSRGAMPYVSRHGFGYSVFEHTEDGISSSDRFVRSLSAGYPERHQLWRTRPATYRLG